MEAAVAEQEVEVVEEVKPRPETEYMVLSRREHPTDAVLSTWEQRGARFAKNADQAKMAVFEEMIDNGPVNEGEEIMLVAVPMRSWRVSIAKSEVQTRVSLS